MSRIGRTDIDIYPICLGGNVFGWTADTDTSYDILDRFMAGGGNFIDTADGYSQWVPGHTGGESETILGEWMSARGNRDQVVIATKVGYKSDRLGLSRDNIIRACDESLARLKTDYIDLYYCHRDDPETPVEETLHALSELVAAGKVRAIASSNFSTERMVESLAVSKAAGFARYEAVQPHFNLLVRDQYEGALQDLCVEETISCFPYYALGAGFLTGKYRSAEAAEGVARGARVSEYLDDRAWRILAALDEVAAAHSTTDAAVALAWLLAQPTVDAPIASATRASHLSDMFAAVELSLSAEDLAALNAASA